MKPTKLIYLLSLFFIFTLLSTSNAYGSAVTQITFPDDVDDQGPVAPIDGFIIIGIAAGAYVGIKKHKQNKA